MAEVTTGQRSGSGNLTPFKPGQSGNPKGINGATKRRQMFLDAGIRVMREKIPTSQGSMISWVAICRAMRNEAVKGDVQAAVWCRDTFAGKPIQQIDLGEAGQVVKNLVLVVAGDGDKERRVELGSAAAIIDVLPDGNGHDGPAALTAEGNGGE